MIWVETIEAAERQADAVAAHGEVAPDALQRTEARSAAAPTDRHEVVLTVDLDPADRRGVIQERRDVRMAQPEPGAGRNGGSAVRGGCSRRGNAEQGGRWEEGGGGKECDSRGISRSARNNTKN